MHEASDLNEAPDLLWEPGSVAQAARASGGLVAASGVCGGLGGKKFWVINKKMIKSPKLGTPPKIGPPHVGWELKNF